MPSHILIGDCVFGKGRTACRFQLRIDRRFIRRADRLSGQFAIGGSRLVDIATRTTVNDAGRATCTVEEYLIGCDLRLCALPFGISMAGAMSPGLGTPLGCS